ncbi:ATP-binding SpoIIE family protein phosphatase [Pseudoroseicyclus aestuarii]|uniref:Anti-sigma regulatory factor (Ser/Thr protein kinase) n=1 Tax=Pseudoroseicyclus aestuarii TaxID=1795041 RepID=A0A318SYU1_9RHOB|nr:ATP-binding SpoIIE family protein phosphatase [Pseudoroseicyclus aestuarii]PYE85599.1 anti-sigma regulatory factor (Ser/Thr protein kinase) [Pseudoroseicyclus aestuarii]
MKQAVEVTEQSGIAEARRHARALAERADLPELRCDEIAIVASEAATNLLRHGGGGTLLLQVVPGQQGAWLCLAAIDKGPGIPDLDAVLHDGVSTAGSSGNGLGAMKRLSDRFALRSVPGEGTVVLCEFGRGPRRIAGVEVAAFKMNYPGETACGDAWSLRNRDGLLELLAVDGLGHGPKAEIAAQEAVEAFARSGRGDPGSILSALSEGLIGTRGSVAGLAQVEAAEGLVRYAGIGNISALVAGPGGDLHRLVGRDGRIGGRSRGPASDSRRLLPGETVILHSDGLSTLHESEGLRALLREPPGLVAASLMRDHNRGRDDACILVARVTPTETGVAA